MLPTLDRSVHSYGGCIRPLDPLFRILQEEERMSTKRQWDESRSPQWKYLLGKESNRKRQNRRHSEKGEKPSSEDEQLLYPLYRKRALTKAEKRERKLKQLKELNMSKEYENSK